MNAILAACGLVAGYILISLLRVIFFPRKRPPPLVYKPKQVGDITLLELSKHDGRDPMRPLLLAVRGRVFDVTMGRPFYGPGAGYSLFAGREVARALAKVEVEESECNDNLEGLSQRELESLADWERTFEGKYEVVGRVVPPLRLTLEQLAQYSGTDSSKPLYLSVCGLVLDVTAGSGFYGPDGAYPFAGRECARALAKFSTEEADLVDDLTGCSLAELDSLKDWQARLYSKYPIIGEVVKEEATPAASEAATQAATPAAPEAAPEVEAAAADTKMQGGNAEHAVAAAAAGSSQHLSNLSREERLPGLASSSSIPSPLPWMDDVAVVESKPLATTGGQTWNAAYRLAAYLRDAEPGIRDPGVSLLELGSGTGWLGITLAANTPHAALVCLTEQPDGVDWLQHNVSISRAAGRPLRNLRVQRCDWNDFGEGAAAGGGGGSSPRAGDPPSSTAAAHTDTPAAGSPSAVAAAAAATAMTLSAPAAAVAPPSSAPQGAAPAQEAGAAVNLRGISWDYLVGSDLVYNEAGSRCLPRVMAALAGPHTRILYCHTKHRFDLLDAELFEQLAACGLQAEEVWEPGTPPPPRSPPPQFPPADLFPDQRIAVFRISKAAPAAS